MSGRRYMAVLESVPVSTTEDLFEIVPDIETIVEILEFHISQETLVGDGNAAVNTIDFITGHTSPGNNRGVDINPLATGDQPFTGIVSRNETTIASGGSPTNVYANTWQNRIPWSVVFSPETNRIISPGGRMVIRIDNVNTDIVVSAHLIFQEFGGIQRAFGKLGIASEIDVASANFLIGIASEEDRNIRLQNSVPEIGIAQGGFFGNSAFEIIIEKRRLIIQVSETDTGFIVVPFLGFGDTIDIAVETDTAFDTQGD